MPFILRYALSILIVPLRKYRKSEVTVLKWSSYLELIDIRTTPTPGAFQGRVDVKGTSSLCRCEIGIIIFVLSVELIFAQLLPTEGYIRPVTASPFPQ